MRESYRSNALLRHRCAPVHPAPVRLDLQAAGEIRRFAAQSPNATPPTSKEKQTTPLTAARATSGRRLLMFSVAVKGQASSQSLKLWRYDRNYDPPRIVNPLALWSACSTSLRESTAFIA